MAGRSLTNDGDHEYLPIKVSYRDQTAKHKWLPVHQQLNAKTETKDLFTKDWTCLHLSYDN